MMDSPQRPVNDVPLFLADPESSPVRRPAPPADVQRTLEEELARDETIDDDFSLEKIRAEIDARATMHLLAQKNAEKHARPEPKIDKEKEPQVKKRKPIPKLDEARYAQKGSHAIY
ncbi:hypothetical protein EXIGLDRAFT_120472 [Exidia glandulosa HHB12029]|uniref:Uncharacterized protein n=1 Tax=Exidia glandulosa HHB12029 TaxID=1314781 RepID=A0A165GEQ7_EXIGL|nr:hypothetical protein EXIGLDRAFT_120472 [Exidia glandulosa HHB12029]